MVGQALRAAQVATDDEATQRRIVMDTMKRIPDLDVRKSPAELSLLVYEITAALTGNHDPYKGLKYAQNEAALLLEPRLREMVERSEDSLSTALHLAAAGNIIDLGILQTEKIDVWAAVEDAMEQGFGVDDTEAFLDSLGSAQSLLYMLDNAGEIVFDKILIEELLKRVKVTAVVKAGPMINDALMEDARQVGLTNLCEVIDNGGAFIGTPVDLVPEDFRRRMEEADIILGKGQGNYETLDGFPGDVFLILKAKCPIIAKDMGVQYGQVALISTRLRREGAKATS